MRPFKLDDADEEAMNDRRLRRWRAAIRKRGKVADVGFGGGAD
jgi:hypothetical protein